MAYFRCGGGLPTQPKSTTATTSQQTVTPDDGYVLESVTVNPQNHSEIYYPSENTSYNDMGINHNKRYVNTSGMVVPSGTKSITSNGNSINVSGYKYANVNVSGTSITPSNSSPASMSSGGLYTPSSSGYAISSYSSVTPSSSGTSFSTGITKMSKSGYAYDKKVSASDCLHSATYEGELYIVSAGPPEYITIDLGGYHNVRYVQFGVQGSDLI